PYDSPTFQILRDQGGLHLPALRVALERACTTRQRDGIEAGFADRQHRPLRDFLQIERHQRRLVRRNLLTILRHAGLPAERQMSAGLDAHDLDVERDIAVPLLLRRHLRIHFRRYNRRLNATARPERLRETGTEPASELGRIADRLPYPLDRRLQQD